MAGAATWNAAGVHVSPRSWQPRSWPPRASWFVAPPPARAATSAPSHDQAFVQEAYHDFLGRAPTAAEVHAATVASLASHAARMALLDQLSTSTEWVSTTVDALYENTLGRPADPSGLKYWVAIIRAHRASVASVSAHFYASSEYFRGLWHV